MPQLLEVLPDDIMGWGLLTIGLQHYAGSSADLAGFAFLVDLAQTGPFSQLLVGIDTDQWNLVLIAQSRDEFLVLGLVAAFGQDAENSLTLVQSLAGFVNTMDQSIGNQGLLQHFLQRCVDIHRSVDGSDRGFAVNIEQLMQHFYLRKISIILTLRHPTCSEIGKTID